MDVPDAYQAYDGGPSPDPPKKRWARGVFRVCQALVYVYLVGIAAIMGVGVWHSSWQWRWHAVIAGGAVVLGWSALVVWRRNRAWAGVRHSMRAATACPDCGYDLINVAHPPPTPGIPGQTARCPECGRGVRYIEPDPAMEDLAQAHSRRNDSATEKAVAPTRTEISMNISDGENASV